MLLHCAISFVIFQLAHSANLTSVTVADYDMLIFTQAWPPTSCYEWEEKNPSHKSELEVKWIDVHKNTKPHLFWRHEWEKHGTCSVDIECINTEVKYFKKGLELLDRYDMKHVLGKANIVPYHKYKLQEYLDGVRKILGVDAYVQCVKNSKRNEIYISELRICFDKQFQLIGCQGIPHFPSNCDKTASIIYPGNVPDLTFEPIVIQV